MRGGHTRFRRWALCRRKLFAAVLSAVVAATVVACSDQPDLPEKLPRGVRWSSGANGNYPADVNAWSKFTGRVPDTAILFTDRRDWYHIVAHNWPVGAFTRAEFPGRISVAQPLFPRDGDEGSCARGDYDGHWAEFGRTLTKFGRSDAYVRLGWEFNGDWFWWYVRDAETWKACFRKAATAIRSTAPDVKIEWNMTAHRDHVPEGGAGVWDAYPGDSYVDVVSIDAYDSYPASVTQKIWDAQCHQKAGLCTVIQFAREHGKPFAVPEWGLVRSAGGGGDNPFYIQKMYETFAANADALAYEAYYNNAEPDNVRSSLYEPVLNPDSRQRYLELFGAG